MKRKRATIIVEVDTDPVPGWGNDPQDFAKLIQIHLLNTVPHYNPSVRVKVSESAEMEVPNA